MTGWSTGRAHSEQNFAVGESGLPHCAHVRASGVAHSSQNLACGRFSCWHRGHFMPETPGSPTGRDRNGRSVTAQVLPGQGPRRLNTDLVQHRATRPLTRRVTLDVDSSESPVHGAQEESAYKGHFESVCYHPLFVFNQEGDCLAAKLRPGNIHSADGWDEVLLPIIDRLQAEGQTVVVRADAAFALPAVYEALERRGVRYAIRLPANNVLMR